MEEKFPEGKFMATVTIGAKGQIVIPKQVRDMFGLKEGDALLLAADKGQGLMLQPMSYAEKFWQEICRVRGEDK